MSSTTYLISGANRGIGFGLVSYLVAADPNAVIYAGARDPSTATALSALATAHSDQVHVVKLEATSEDDAKAAAEHIKATSGRLDVVIANAGISGETFLDAATVGLDAMRKHFEVNTLGPLIVYQATHELLSIPAPGRPGPPNGASKAAGNMVLAKIHLHAAPSDLVVLCIHPGAVQTETALTAGKLMGFDEDTVLAIFSTTVEDSVKGVLQVVGEAKKEEKLQFLDFKGETIPW